MMSNLAKLSHPLLNLYTLLKTQIIQYFIILVNILDFKGMLSNIFKACSARKS